MHVTRDLHPSIAVTCHCTCACLCMSQQVACTCAFMSCLLHRHIPVTCVGHMCMFVPCLCTRPCHCHVAHARACVSCVPRHIVSATRITDTCMSATWHLDQCMPVTRDLHPNMPVTCHCTCVSCLLHRRIPATCVGRMCMFLPCLCTRPCHCQVLRAQTCVSCVPNPIVSATCVTDTCMSATWHLDQCKPVTRDFYLSMPVMCHCTCACLCACPRRSPAHLHV